MFIRTIGVHCLEKTSITTTKLGLYCHVPFCAHRCSYCACYQEQPTSQLIEQYLFGVEKEFSLLGIGQPICLKRILPSGINYLQNFLIKNQTMRKQTFICKLGVFSERTAMNTMKFQTFVCPLLKAFTTQIRGKCKIGSGSSRPPVPNIKTEGSPTRYPLSSGYNLSNGGIWHTYPMKLLANKFWRMIDFLSSQPKVS
ncbi:MAG: hypothetical protein LBD34_01540 [Puniceicoccales bacterium]|nr:hypothetical protein [Puniceicoccales bacterium]